MHIMIAGAGTVGYSLAEILSYKHDIIIVDKDIKRLNKIEENLDILISDDFYHTLFTFDDDWICDA